MFVVPHTTCAQGILLQVVCGDKVHVVCSNPVIPMQQGVLGCTACTNWGVLAHMQGDTADTSSTKE